MPANTKVGELDLELGGKSYVLRPSFEVMQAVENLTGKACSEIIMDINRGTPRATEIVQVLWSGASRNNKKVPAFGKFGQLLSREMGIPNAGALAGIFLTNGMLSDDQLEAHAAKVEAEEEAEAQSAEESDPEVLSEAAEDPNPSE